VLGREEHRVRGLFAPPVRLEPAAFDHTGLDGIALSSLNEPSSHALGGAADRYRPEELMLDASQRMPFDISHEPRRGAGLATALTQDGLRLYVEDLGTGSPVLFVHEFAGDHRSWEPQVRAFSRRHRCITYAARGYAPSDVPDDPDRYSQAHAVADAIAVLDELGVKRAHVVGLSMGGFVSLHMARLHPDRVRSAVVAGVGYGTPYEQQAKFQAECEVIAEAFATEGAKQVAGRYAYGPARVQFQNKDPRGHAEFAAQLAEHSSVGSAHTMRGFQAARPSLYDFAEEFANVRVPVLLLTGDEDEGCLEPDLWLKRTLPNAGLMVLPRSGHTLNLEEPALFNQVVGDFICAAEADALLPRDPRSLATSTTGMTDD
jgi:pimeloyl-ACP methyl ester carboxylesterase